MGKILTNKFDMERVFAVARHMSDPDTRASNFTKFKVPLNPAQQQDFLRLSLQAFVHGVAEAEDNESGKLVIQAFAGSSDLPTLTKDVFDVIVQAPNFDLAWQRVFKGIQLQKGQLSWELTDVTNAIEFREIPEGGKVDIRPVSGNKATAAIKKYGAGLGVTWEIMEGNKLYAFAERLEIMRAKLYELWANIHYGLLSTAAGTRTTAWRGVEADKTIDRDIATLNAGAYAIGNACKAKGYGDMANAPMILFANPTLRARINAAIKASRELILANGGKGTPVDWPIDAQYSFNSNITSGKALLVLPGQKIQNSVYLRELGLSKQEIESLNEIRTYWTAFGAIVGDADQTRELSFA
jgi:hypothetical protein